MSRRALLGLERAQEDETAAVRQPPNNRYKLERIYPLRTGASLRQDSVADGVLSLDQRLLALSDGSLTIRQIAHVIGAERALERGPALEQTRAALDRLRAQGLVSYAKAGSAALRDRVIAHSTDREPL